MVAREIVPDVYSVGVIDWDRTVFDELMHLASGTSYNAYVVRGSEKTALIDTADPHFEEAYISNLVRVGLTSVDYIIVNHAEQDHSGLLPLALELFPHAKVVTTEKGRDLCCILHHILPERFVVVGDGDTLSLGNKTLTFLSTPWVHWPETMMTYLEEDKILFSCDFLGAHIASSDLYADDSCKFWMAARQYYAEIMQPFRAKVREHTARVRSLGPAMIAPSHGPVHRSPAGILDAYEEWSSDEVKNFVLIPYVSMHGSTREMVDRLVDLLIERGIDVRPYDLGRVEPGAIAYDLIDAATIILGAPTMLFGPHPKAAYIAFITNILKPKAKWIGVIGSYGWGTKTIEDLTGMLGRVDAELLEPVYIKGKPDEETNIALARLAAEIYKRHADHSLV
ncbi:MAG TPA: FprA family A-type flavoprotein [Methanoculleus sp.]|nr:FprA family A-type flavoprotein [Methanoculleus sp.]